MAKEKISNRIKNFFKESFGIGEKNFQFLLNLTIIILINIAGVTLNIRMDLTRNGTYSLSEKSKTVVANLKENLKIRVLFSHELPAEHSTILRYLKDLLNEYDYYGNRYFSYDIVDKENLAKQAQDFGIRPVTSREFADDQIKTRQTYMGLVIQQADVIEKIEAVTNPVGLEYMITSRLEKISSKIDGLLNLKDPVKLNLYLDKNVKTLPIDGIDDLEKQIRGAVDKSNVNNFGKIKFQLMESMNKEDVDGIVKKYGITRLTWPGGKSRSGEKLEPGEGVFGIVVEKGNRFQKINLNIAQSLFGNYVIVGLDKIDEKINDAIGSLLNANKKIGYITGHGIIDINNSQSRDGGGIYKQLLSDIYEIVSIDLSKQPIPDDIETIIVNGPKDKFTDFELYRIDQFLMNGKSALFFIDSFNEVQLPGGQNMFQQKQPMVLPVNSGLEDMLKHYGIRVHRDIVLDKNSAKINLGNMVRDYPLIPVIRKNGLNRENIITKHLNSVVFVKSSSIGSDDKKLKELGIKRTDLVSSSKESWLMKGRINFNPMNMNPAGARDMKSYNLAALFSGKFESYFKNRAVPVKEDKKKKKPMQGNLKSVEKLDMTVDSGNTNLILVGTSEITRSGFLMYSRKILGSGSRGEVYSNDHLLHSLVDSLTGNTYIPEMKSKSLEYNPLDKTSDKKRFILKSANIGGLPLAIVILGLFIWRRRLSRKRRLLSEFNREA